MRGLNNDDIKSLFRQASSPVTAPPSFRRRRKSLGQHFLTDQRTVCRIVHAAALKSDDLVIEIGPGRGVLTRRLVELVETVIALELDPELCAQLPVRLGTPHNLICVEADARTADFGPLVPSGRDYKVVANLPYYAANPIIRNLLETVPKPSVLVVMVQKEVADSMVALPGRMGLLSVATQLYAEAQTVCTVPPEAFRPPPAVTSAVVKLVTRAAPAVAVDDGAEFVPSEFFDVVRAGFSAPRKQLRNSFSHGLGIASDAASGVLDRAGVDGQRRAQTLDLAEWGRLYRAWRDRPSRNGPGI